MAHDDHLAVDELHRARIALRHDGELVEVHPLLELHGAQPCEPMRVSERAMPSISRLVNERSRVLDTQ